MKIRSRASDRASSGSESSRMPSANTPVWGAQIARIRPGVSVERERGGLHDQVVVAQRLPLLEVHAPAV